jgi:hypothetical protein
MPRMRECAHGIELRNICIDCANEAHRMQTLQLAKQIELATAVHQTLINAEAGKLGVAEDIDQFFSCHYFRDVTMRHEYKCQKVATAPIRAWRIETGDCGLVVAASGVLFHLLGDRIFSAFDPNKESADTIQRIIGRIKKAPLQLVEHKSPLL